MIIVDTREQKPLWREGHNTMKDKLIVGDYTTEKLRHKYHIERKSPCDLYGSIIQGHKRFRKELQRAIDNKIKMSIYVECSKSDFIAKNWKGGYARKVKPKVLAKIVDTIQDKYNIDFVWCKGRTEMKLSIKSRFQSEELLLNIDIKE